MIIKTSLFTATALLAATSTAALADTTSAADKAFVAMVSQGGMFETKAGTYASTHGSTQDIKDQGSTEAHDHALVGAKLSEIAAADGLPIAGSLNATFSKMMADLSAKSGKAFDNLYLTDMATIHAKDGAAFAKEAAGGTDPKLRAFAAETHVIVLRHIGEIKAVGPSSP